MILDVSVVNVHKQEGGEAATLRFNVNDAMSADLNRARIEASNETPEALARVVIEEIKRQLPGSS
jgi:hypothetical protein